VLTPKLLFEASYTLDGIKGVQSAGGTRRRDAVGSGYTVDPIELIDAGDQVVAVAQVTGVGAVSQIAMEDRDQFAFLFTFKNGRAVREQAFRNREDALDAAGLRDSAG